MDAFFWRGDATRLLSKALRQLTQKSLCTRARTCNSLKPPEPAGFRFSGQSACGSASLQAGLMQDLAATLQPPS